MFKTIAFIILANISLRAMSWFPNIIAKTTSSSMGPVRPILQTSTPISWDALDDISQMNPTSAKLNEEARLRNLGEGPPHTDSKIRLFGTTEEPRVTYYRDSAAW